MSDQQGDSPGPGGQAQALRPEDAVARVRHHHMIAIQEALLQHVQHPSVTPHLSPMAGSHHSDKHTLMAQEQRRKANYHMQGTGQGTQLIITCTLWYKTAVRMGSSSLVTSGALSGTCMRR